MKSVELIRQLEKNGWLKVSQKGSHIKFRHPVKKGHIVVPHHKGRDIPVGTLISILKKAGLR